ncbi:undecaprenyl-phosphate glucose phosphotransferase [Desertivirga xinjiangensis]|uniref:undecaprenyl-phosphate glucose phosphotransferase n=1 Tax=Desertivirga xinjiangensis TaxID=539206 RepID=UPI00210C1872|nr:undecaprenyl-phosphate glucose phosphotransferase [Pedobacter xinjiangensis]
MQSRYLYSLRLLLGGTDLLILNFSFFLAFYMGNNLDKALFFDHYRQYLININILWLLSSNMLTLYSKKTIMSLENVYRASWKSMFLHMVFWVFFLSFSKDQQISRVFLGLFYTFFAVNLLISRFLLTVIENILSKHFKIRKPVAVMGRNNTSLRLATFFEKDTHYNFEGFLDQDDYMFVDNNGQLLPAACEQIKRAADNGIKEVYVSLTADKLSEAGSLMQEAERQCVRLKFVPDFSQSIASPFTINYMGEFPVISMRKEPLEQMHSRFRKRLADILFSSAVIIFVLSWLYPILAIIIKLQSPGPVLFKQLRSGRNNEMFWCYKFRSMKMNKDSDAKQATKNDDRVTRIGRFMRKTSLDELPQFFNVLLGNMSVVGPRPHMLKHTEQYRAIIDKYMVRHYLKPGITGWAQVNGFRGETINLELMEKRVEHDIWYLENWSAMLDVKIVFLTIINMLKGEESAY